MIFAMNALGFFVQFYPCALMIFLPFREETYRVRKKNLYICLTAVSAAFSCGYSAFMCLRDLEKYPSHVTLSNVSMLAAMLITLAAYAWIVRESLLKKILVFFIVLFYAVTVYMGVSMFRPFFLEPGHVPALYAYDGLTLVMFAVTTAVLLPLMLVFVIGPLKEYIREIEPKSMKREFTLTILSTMLYFVMLVYCNTFYGTYSGVGKWGLAQQHHILTLLMMLNQILIYWLIFQESVQRKRESERSRAVEIQQFQYEKIVSDIENTRRMRHDLRHHYNTLNDMLDRGKLQEMRDYLAGVIDTTVRRDSELYCKNLTVNGLLQYYIGLARDEGIRTEARAECGEMNIEPADLTVLFGNAMENAINACRKCQDEKWIRIKIGTVQESLAIEISNSCSGVRLNRHYQTEDGFSPAEAFLSDHAGGYGLQSIARTAQKYGGSANFRYNSEKKKFTARIRLNMRTAQAHETTV